MNKANKKGVTLNDLASMVASGFENVPTKDEMNSRFDGVNQRIDGVHQRIDKVEYRLGKLEYRVDEVYEILARFEEGDILDLQKRIKILERTVKAMAKHIG